ncbi:unnamed protein product, partial [Iphiclides podalirius]
MYSDHVIIIANVTFGDQRGRGENVRSDVHAFESRVGTRWRFDPNSESRANRGRVITQVISQSVDLSVGARDVAATFPHQRAKGTAVDGARESTGIATGARQQGPTKSSKHLVIESNDARRIPPVLGSKCFPSARTRFWRAHLFCILLSFDSLGTESVNVIIALRARSHAPPRQMCALVSARERSCVDPRGEWGRGGFCYAPDDALTPIASNGRDNRARLPPPYTCIRNWPRAHLPAAARAPRDQLVNEPNKSRHSGPPLKAQVPIAEEEREHKTSGGKDQNLDATKTRCNAGLQSGIRFTSPAYHQRLTC